MSNYSTHETNRWAITGMVTGGMVGGLLFGLLVIWFSPGPTVGLAEGATEAHETISGTLNMVNVAEKKGAITTDLGKEVAFQIAKPELFINLSVGQRVTIKLDDQGRAVRVMDSAAPELPPPSTPR
ncbi:MAG: hypothetical protein K0S45_4081 [Nitrospira sp.]|nr:hypothetical protein [Nitrospira sp.]